MKRLVLIALIAGSVGVLAAGARGDGSEYQVSAVFDSAQGLVPGQLVKIAGARVGSVERVELIPGKRYRARLLLKVEGKYGPFRADASCRLLPEGVISEKFVDCDPGSPGKPALPDGRSGRPELADTATPLSLQDVLNIFSTPTNDRLRILFNELGMGTAGQGADINAILRDSNPALTQADRVLEIVNRQRSRIATAVGDTDRVLAALAADDKAVRDFVTRGAGVATTAASRSSDLRRAIRALPPLLDATDHGLRSLNRAMADGGPVLGDARAAGPKLDRFTRLATGFANSGRPALEQLTGAARTANAAMPPLARTVRQFADFGSTAPPALADLGDLLTSIRDTGGWEGLLKSAYGLAVGAAARDEKSHYYGAVINLFPICILIPPEVVVVPGCTHRYNSPEKGRIPINDPTNQQAQKRAFLKWLRIGGPAKSPRYLRSSLQPLVRKVAGDLGVKLDADQLRSVARAAQPAKATTPKKPPATPRSRPLEGLLDYLFE